MQHLGAVDGTWVVDGDVVRVEDPVVVGEVERDDVGVVEGEVVLVVDGVVDPVDVRDVEGVEVGLVDGVLVRDVEGDVVRVVEGDDVCEVEGVEVADEVGVDDGLVDGDAESADAHTSNTKAHVRTTATAAARGCDMAWVCASASYS